MKWTKVTEESLPKSSGFPILLIFRWFDINGDRKTFQLTANQMADRLKWDATGYDFLDESHTEPQAGWATDNDMKEAYWAGINGFMGSGHETENYDPTGGAVQWLSEYKQLK